MQVYVYTENKERKRIEVMWVQFIYVWKTEIYRKKPRMNLDFWYGTTSMMGLKEKKIKENIENMNRGQGRMMPLPKMKEEDLVRIIRKQKNNKAAGVDGVKAEVMKHIIRNRKIRKALVTAFNKSVKEPVNRRWLESYTTMLPNKKKPKNKEHRPIAVTCWSSKIMCSLIREKLEIHLETWAYGFEIQYGFTKGGKGEFCLFTLNYVANRTFKSQK